MNRTYNFQVDNGIFVAEYYLKKKYEDITVGDLKENVEIFADKMFSYNQLGTLSSTTHHNTVLTQNKKNKKMVSQQLNTLLDNIGSDKTCFICGEKRVNLEDVELLYKKNKDIGQLPYSSLLFGLASHNSFMNRSNNMQTIDVCPVCLFLSYISFLNTRKISYPFLYNSDSDDFMRDTTKDIQVELSKGVLLDLKMEDMNKQFIQEMSNIMMKEDLYDDLQYINLISFSNGKSNMVEDVTIDRDKLIMLMKLKNKGLMPEFYKRKMFKLLLSDRNLITYLANGIKYGVCSIEMYKFLRGYFMTSKEIELVEQVTNNLIKNNDINKVKSDISLVKGKMDFKNFLIKYTKNGNIVDSLLDMDIMIKNNYDFKDYITLNLNLKGDN